MFIISYRLPYEKLDSTIEELAINDIYNVFYENPLEITTDDYGYGYIERDDEEIILTSAEYKLLLILIQNKNVVLTRAQILEKLWDVTYDFVNDNTLSVYIKRLREKIEEDSSKPEYILTVRGVGYKWNGSDTNENTI